MIDFTLTDEQLALQMKSREFAHREILPVAWYFDEMDEMPLYVLERAYKEGLMNLGIPKKYGGQGHGMLDASIAVEEFASCGPGLATSIFDNGLGQEPLILSTNEIAKEKYLTDIIKNFKLISFATSETGMGSDVAGMRCKATPDGKDYILNGTKYWVTNGGFADYATIFATVDRKLRHKGIVGVVIETDWDGVSVVDHIPKMGQRTSNTVALKFDNVRVPAENVLGREGGEGFGLAMNVFSHTRPMIGAFAVGAARSAMEFAMQHAMNRKAFGQPIGAFQGIQFKIAEMFQKVETSRLMIWRSAWEADQGRDCTLWASMTKFYTTEAAFEVANDALQILGGYGYTKYFPVEKLLRDIRLLQIYEGTNQVQRMIVLKYLMKGGFQPIMPKMEDLPRLRAKDVKEAARKGMEQQTVWRCKICGHLHYGDEPPEECPVCRMKKGAFRKVWPKKE
ncbi:acyl-CoA dehydrogenase family protein [Promethearchaeum syntrophicum]|uniref:Acyl-CoA dehydrogenase family protein n=1 Tax=Promethearchaeum syntrophicum TaxID=2594042 RepID=A0A5B9D8V9_9ARCH|nr:acyl-CoA dehydrogenase family protein [Candidatus Prometheoarchaeum syntrophicum]QEE15297.1 putative acyl-CoA dehydrogenase [Candidatus Prometheoarchaeum syntrophicum]